VVIKVLIAEDVHMVRGALVALLRMESDIEVVAEVAGGNDIMPTARTTQPDVAVIDIDLPGKDGLTAAAEPARTVTELPDADPHQPGQTGHPAQGTGRQGRRLPAQGRPTGQARQRDP